MPLTKAAQAEYTEIEAAEQLGVDVDRFRTLVRNHIIRGDDELPALGVATFKQSDLVVLKILCSQSSSMSMAS